MAEKILSFKIEIRGVSEEAKAIAKLDTQLSKLNEERKEANRLHKEGEITLKQRRSTLAKITRTQADLRTERTKLTAVEKKASQQYKSGAGSINQLRLRMQRLRDEMRGLNLETQKGRDRFKRLNTELQAGTTRLRNFDRQMSGSKTLVGEYGRGIKGAFTSLAIGITAGVAAFRTLSRAIQTTTKDLAEFEKGQANVQTLLDEFNNTLTGDSLRLIKQYGLEIQDVNKALFDAVSAGIPAGRAVEFLSDAAKLAIGGVTSLSVAVDGITSVLNGYGLAASEADRVAAAFFTAQKFGKTTVAELAAEIGKVVPIAKQLNVTYQEVLATFAETTKQGIATTESATAIKNIMVALLKPTREAKEKFDDLGIAYGANNVKQEGFLNVFKQIITAVNNGDAELAELIPNIRALTGAGALGTEQLAELDEILKDVNEDFGEGSSLAKAFAIQQDTLANAQERLSAGLAATRVRLGEVFEPLVKGLANLINPLQKSSALILEEQVRLNALAGAVKNAGDETELRARLIGQINDEYPDFLAGLDAEKTTNEDIAVALEDVNKLYVQRIRVAVGEELYTRQAKALADLIEKELIYATSVAQTQNEIVDLKKERDDYYRVLIQQTTDAAEQELILQAIQEDRWVQFDASITRANFKYQQLNGHLTGAQQLLEQNQEEQALINDTITKQLALLEAERILLNQITPTPAGGGTGGTGGGGRRTVLPEVQKVIEETTVRFTSEEAEIYRQILADVQLQFELYAGDADAINEAIFQNQLDRWNQETLAFIEKEQKKRAIVQATNEIVNAGINFLFNRNQKLLNMELEAAGDNAEKKDEIRKKFAKKEQAIAVKEAIIKTGLLILNAALTQPFIPLGLIASIGAAIIGGIQIATIKQQSFTGGGMVQPGSELPGAPRDGDNTMIMAKPGEVVLNESQQRALGGSGTFKKIGVPGFATGGVVGVAPPQPGSGAADTFLMTRALTSALNDIQVILNVNELNAANGDLDVINSTNPL